MYYEIKDYRLGLALLEHQTHRAAWLEVMEILDLLDETRLVARHLDISRARLATQKQPPVGLQTALNDIIKEELHGRYGWVDQPRLFEGGGEALSDWKMDFYKDKIGIEVAFNNASYFPWIFTRLNLAGESEGVLEEHRIDVGITICAKTDLKKWGRMDSSVGTYELVSRWLDLMKPITPTPMILIGLSSDVWIDLPIFGRAWWTSSGGKLALES